MRTAIAVTAVCCSVVGLTLAENVTAAVRRAIDIPPQPLSNALRTLADERDFQILYVAAVVGDARTAGAQGELTPIEALDRLLAGTGLVFGVLDERTVTIKRPDGKAAASDSAGTSAGGMHRYLHVAQVAIDPPPPSSTTIPAAISSDSEPKRSEVEEVVVTGTHIRGGTTSSPVIAIDSVRIKEEGFIDLGEVIRSVPQSFAGGQNPGVSSLGLSGGGLQNQNLTGGSTLNLRGLGPDATLTLLNGRRLAYGGFSQAVDISAIPVDAVDRLEIVADGASAIYGSDAVGGVGNVILKRDFDGVALSARYGATTEGGLTTRDYNVSAGTAWSSGGVIATYKAVSADPIYAQQRDYTDQLTYPTTIYPGADLHSGLLSVHQSIGDMAEFRLDALRTKRDQLYNAFLFGLNTHVTPRTTTSFASPSIEFKLPRDWTMFIAGTWGKDEHLQIQSRQNLTTGVSTPQIHDCYCNDTRSYETGAAGPLLRLAGGDAMLAVGAGYRTNDFQQFNHLTNNSLIRGDESSRFAYGEINLPLLGRDSDGIVAQRLTATAAVRSEDYDSHGVVTTPKFGLIYSPSDDITLKASWGKSFKMPTLFQLYRAPVVGLVPPGIYGGTGFAPDATVLALGGGNPDLEPERARTLTTSLAFHPEVLPRLDMELTWFDIDYTDRVIQPIANPSEALSNPVYAQFVEFSPSDEEKARVASLAPLLNFSGAAYDPDNVVAILYDQYLNVSSQRIKGLDLSGSYPFELGGGQLMVRGAASWLDSSQRTSEAQTPRALSGTLFNPAKINSRLGAVWSQSSFIASLFVNYTGGVTNIADGKKTASFTTVDATFRYNTGTRSDPLSELDFALSALNLFDRDPPLHTPAVPYMAPYDSTNYSVMGRFLSLTVSKRW